MVNVLDVAKFFLASNAPNSITNVKLQNLCAYAQAISIAYLGEKFFNESIEMWESGPVIRTIYDKYKHYGSTPIPQSTLDMSPFTMQQRLVLAVVNDQYANMYDTWELCKQSHQDFFSIKSSNQIINEEDLKQAFNNNPLVEQLRRVDLEPVPV